MTPAEWVLLSRIDASRGGPTMPAADTRRDDPAPLSAAQRSFLAAYAAAGSVTAAAAAARVHRLTHYKWSRRPAYARAFAAAQEQAEDAMADEALRRAEEWQRA